jgi:type IV pilus biogenesis protein PilP
MKSITLALLSTAIITPAWAAQPQAPAAPVETQAEKLANLQAQKALGKLRLEVARQEAEIAEAKGKSGASFSATAPAAPVVTKPPKPVDLPPPALVSISSVGDKITAIVLNGGMRKAVKVGDVLYGGWTVDKLETTSVTVSRAGQTQTLRP